MLKIVVRGRKDRSAVAKSIDLFYPGWNIRVESLGGVRGEKIVERLGEALEPFTIVVSGRRDKAWFSRALEELAPLPPLVAFSIVDRADVRNARLEMIAHSIDAGRAMLRGTAEWVNDGYRFYFSLEGKPVRKPVDPEVDNFLFRSKGFHALPLKPENRLVLAYKMREGKHEFYCGPSKAGVARFGLTGTQVEEWYPAACPDVPESRLVENNRLLLETLESAAVGFLRDNVPEEVEKVVVPWSGGKDSTAALLLAVKALGKRRVVAVNVDTGTEFPLTLEYVERVARMLGVDVVTVNAGLREAINSRGLPKLGERWCTGLKLEALRKAIGEITGKRRVVIVGDRDAESKLRVRRPQTRLSEDEVGLAPLKLWGGVHVQLYLLWSGVPLNPLYDLGFYRIGCYICPSLRDWELTIVKSQASRLRLAHDRLLERFLRERYTG